MTAEELWVEQSRVQRAYVAAFGQQIYIATEGIESFGLATNWLRHRMKVLNGEALRRRNRRSA